MNKMKHIIWITAQSGAGKSTLAYGFQKKHTSFYFPPNCVILDGDEMRESISLGAGFSKEDREEHNLRVARLAKVLLAQNHLVLVSVIAPFRDTRAKLEGIVPIKWVYIERALKLDENRPYEIPMNYSLKIDADNNSKNKCVEIFEDWLKTEGIKL
jgi:adenylylsulfate kinase-like enzyme